MEATEPVAAEDSVPIPRMELTVLIMSDIRDEAVVVVVVVGVVMVVEDAGVVVGDAGVVAVVGVVVGDAGVVVVSCSYS